MITVAVITVSDSVLAGTRQDLSGPAVRERVESYGWTVSAVQLVADESLQIAEAMRNLANSREVSVVLTTGGTGVALRDVTPEATRSVIEREIPGLGELMRSEGRKFTSKAVLSRGLAGVRGRTLIVNLPGSPKGAVESLDAIAKLIPHVVDLLEGRTAHDSDVPH
jgi:molybdenum cofactor synthesis domain-containing protein